MGISRGLVRAVRNGLATLRKRRMAAKRAQWRRAPRVSDARSVIMIFARSAMTIRLPPGQRSDQLGKVGRLRRLTQTTMKMMMIGGLALKKEKAKARRERRAKTKVRVRG